MKIYLATILLSFVFTHYGEVLNKYEITNAKYRGAVCNDGTPGIYYLKVHSNSPNWVIFFEGGGGCFSLKDCKKRITKSPYYTSSNNYPDKIEARSLFSHSMLKTYNKLILIYCSSDFWLGNDTYMSGISNISTNSSKNDSMFFRGRVLVKSIVDDIESRFKLNSSSNLLIAGNSAGGVGAINNMDILQHRFNKSKIKLLLDSAWFINYQNYFTELSDKNFFKQSGIIQNDLCRDLTRGFPCCLSISCVISQNVIPQNIEIMGIFSKYDIYILSNVLLTEQRRDQDFQMKDITMYVHEYGGQMTQSLNFVQSSSNFNFIFPSCFQHVYIFASDLRGRVYSTHVEYNYASITFKHTVESEHWNTMKINGKSISDYFTSWYKNNSTRNNTKIVDTCAQAQCNPTCPKMIFFNQSDYGSSEWTKLLLISIVIVIIIICLLIKLLWCIKHIRLKREQMVYIIEKNRTDASGEQVQGLPQCALHNSVGISCSSLQYDILDATHTEPSENTSEENKINKRKYSIRNLRKSVYLSPKPIIKGVTAYFNPGQLVAIMGPSGSGKTTLLDVLTARKYFNETEENIFINGLPASETRDWFIKNSGYVLQLATPYHEELTVRQNLTYSAMMRLPEKMDLKGKMWRVEQVLAQTGLCESANVIVGGNDSLTNGLSGGQKRRLCIAMQLIDLPSVLFLDEPTSGLDSASSLELLETLHRLTLSGRLVVVTIHQPRIEIFHMFNTILLLSEGKVAYFGSPIIAPAKMAEGLQGSGKTFDASNPADSIMDVLMNSESQNIIVEHYHESGEIEAINRAINRARRHPQKTLSMKFQKQTSSLQNRLLALDGRSTAAQTFSQKLYFPLIFLLYSLALGTCYWQTTKGVLLMSCYMVFSCASQLFMASAIHTHLNKALALFALEKADGIGHSHELVLHAFVRVFSQSSIPLVGACMIIFFCTFREYDMWKFFLTTLIHLQLNQTWIAIIILTACATPRYSPLVTPLLSAISGFAGGFLVPEPQMPIIYYWLFYINPTHWAYGGMVNALLKDVTFDCKWNSPLECESSMGIVVLEQFGLHNRNPYNSMIVLLVMLVVSLAATVLVLELKYSKRQFDQATNNYFHGTRIKIANYFTNIAKRVTKKQKRLKDKMERERLLQLVEQEYVYNGDNVQTSAPNSALYPSSPDIGKKTHYSYTDDTLEDLTEDSSKEEDTDPCLSKVTQTSRPLTTLLTKIQTNLPGHKLSKEHEHAYLCNESNLIDKEIEIPMRSKSTISRIGKNILNRRRKTFHGDITDDDKKKAVEARPKSMSELVAGSNNGIELKPLIHQNAENTKQKSESSIEKSEEKLKTESVIINIEPEIAEAKQPLVQLEEVQFQEHVTEQKLEPKLEDIENNPDPKPKAKKTPETSRKNNKRRNQRKYGKRRQRDESKDTWSNYLDVKLQRHEVFCALSSVKRRIRGMAEKKEKKASINLQRKASHIILDERRKSMRYQITDLQKQTSNTEVPYRYRKRANSSTRRKNSFKSPSSPKSQRSSVDPCSSRNNSNQTEEHIIERLSLLSSIHSNRNSSHTNSKVLPSTSSTSETPHTETGFERDRLYSVLRKLGTLEEPTISDDSLSDEVIATDENTKANLRAASSSFRDSDPFLPEERELVQNLLSKHNILLPPSPEYDQKVTFSSTVKIKGVSPNASRKPSSAENRNSRSYSLNNKASEDNNETSNIHPRIDAGDGLVHDLKNSTEPKEQNEITTHRRRRRSYQSEKQPGRKISITVKSIVRPTDDEILPADNRESTFYDDVSSDSSSSDYESDVIKTEEGFIIPDDTINRVILNNARRESKSNQEEIEKQFKKDNFLKDRPVRRGIRMPIGSAGKVNLLKSKFEKAGVK